MKFNIHVKNIKKMKFISKIFKIYKKEKKNWYIKSLKNFSHLALGENLFDEASSASLLFKVMVNIGQNGPLASIVEIFGPIALFAK